MNIDITEIVNDKIRQMENDGEIEKLIKDNIGEAIKGGITSALGGYELQRAIRNEMEISLPSIVGQIGLPAYNTYIAHIAREYAEEYMEKDAADQLCESLDTVLSKKRGEIKLSELLQKWRDEMSDEDPDDGHDKNENHDGYTCCVKEMTSYLTSFFKRHYIFFDELGDVNSLDPQDYQVAARVRAVVRSAPTAEPDKAVIEELYIRGQRVSKRFLACRYGSFEGLLLNLYLNETPIIMDLSEHDEDDHYYPEVD